MVAVVPTLSRVVATIGTEHPAATEADLERDVVDRRVAGGDETRDQTQIIGRVTSDLAARGPPTAATAVPAARRVPESEPPH